MRALQGQQKSQITGFHRTHALAGNRVIFSAEVVRYHVKFLRAETEELKKRGCKLFQLLVFFVCELNETSLGQNLNDAIYVGDQTQTSIRPNRVNMEDDARRRDDRPI